MPWKKRADQVPENKTLTQSSESDNSRGYGHYARGNPENEVGLIKYKHQVWMQNYAQFMQLYNTAQVLRKQIL